MVAFTASLIDFIFYVQVSNTSCSSLLQPQEGDIVLVHYCNVTWWTCSKYSSRQFYLFWFSTQPVCSKLKKKHAPNDANVRERASFEAFCCFQCHYKSEMWHFCVKHCLRCDCGANFMIHRCVWQKNLNGKCVFKTLFFLIIIIWTEVEWFYVIFSGL